jgi:ABC-type uncharacterized transport system ATPase subunit
MVPGSDPQAVLVELARRTRVERFELTRPSLHDIFVRIARPEPVGVQALTCGQQAKA